MQTFEVYMEGRSRKDAVGIFPSTAVNALMDEVGADAEQFALGLDAMTDSAEEAGSVKPENIMKARAMIKKNRYSFDRLLAGAWNFIARHDTAATGKGGQHMAGFTAGSTMG